MDYFRSDNFINIQVTLSTILILYVVELFYIVAAGYWLHRKWRSSLYKSVNPSLLTICYTEYVPLLPIDLLSCPQISTVLLRDVQNRMDLFTEQTWKTIPNVSLNSSVVCSWHDSIIWSRDKHSTLKHIVKPNWVYSFCCFVQLVYQHAVKIFPEGRMVNRIVRRQCPKFRPDSSAACILC